MSFYISDVFDALNPIITSYRTNPCGECIQKHLLKANLIFLYFSHFRLTANKVTGRQDAIIEGFTEEKTSFLQAMFAAVFRCREAQ